MNKVNEINAPDDVTAPAEAQDGKESDDSWIFGALICLLLLAALVVGSCKTVMEDRLNAMAEGIAMRDKALNLALTNFCPDHADEISQVLGLEPLPRHPAQGTVKAAP